MLELPLEYQGMESRHVPQETANASHPVVRVPVSIVRLLELQLSCLSVPGSLKVAKSKNQPDKKKKRSMHVPRLCLVDSCRLSVRMKLNGTMSAERSEILKK